MAKMVQVSKAEHEMLVAAYAQDGLKIAMLETELDKAKRAIRRLITVANSSLACDFCCKNPETCGGICELTADWNGWDGDAER